MNKAEFVDAVADGAELSKADAARAVDAFTGTVANALKSGDSVYVRLRNARVFEEDYSI